MRIGWMIGPAAVMPQVIKAHGWLTSTANTFAQRVAIEAFTHTGGLMEQFAWYRDQREGVVQALDRSGLPYLPIDGSFFVSVHVGEGVDTLAASHRLLEEYDVVAIPGAIFSPAFEGWMRLSWVADLDVIREGLERIARAFGRTPANA
jgi:aspartate/methionine/tyrosine aminotransferase